MSFIYNEAGCETIKAYFSKRLSLIQNEIAFLERELDTESRPTERIAIEERLNQCNGEAAFAQQKIAEMESNLDSTPRL